MISWIRQLDELLRGDRLRGEVLAQGRADISFRVFVPMACVLGAIYGLFMGWYALFRGADLALLQALSSSVKFPALFLLTLLVTFPSLYVFNALVGCRMSFGSTARVLVAAIAVNLAVAASLGPILAFFTVSTTSYAFMIVLNVALLSLAGFVSVGFLLRGLRGLAHAQALAEAGPPTDSNATVTAVDDTPQPAPAPQATPTAAPSQGDSMTTAFDAAFPSRSGTYHGSARLQREQAIAHRRATADFILLVWVTIYALVGAQMGWVLRPFIGSPDMPFEFVRGRSGSFFNGALGSLARLLGL